jgi:hypothetical protein
VRNTYFFMLQLCCTTEHVRCQYTSILSIDRILSFGFTGRFEATLRELVAVTGVSNEDTQAAAGSEERAIRLSRHQ